VRQPAWSKKGTGAKVPVPALRCMHAHSCSTCCIMAGMWDGADALLCIPVTSKVLIVAYSPVVFGIRWFLHDGRS
jgi:hypothetical protein